MPTLDEKDIIPSEVRQIARLGTLPSPIVNFNLELWTSWAIAGGGHGPYTVRTFVPSDAKGPIDARYQYGAIRKQFARSVYHPHGAIEASGRTVLTSTDYRHLNGTLAFQIAVHQAFQADLAIVGMSLDDRYLREQLTLFRYQIKQR